MTVPLLFGFPSVSAQGEGAVGRTATHREKREERKNEKRGENQFCDQVRS